jgi:hypothetical protein
MTQPIPEKLGSKYDHLSAVYALIPWSAQSFTLTPDLGSVNGEWHPISQLHTLRNAVGIADLRLRMAVRVPRPNSTTVYGLIISQTLENRPFADMKPADIDARIGEYLTGAGIFEVIDEYAVPDYGINDIEGYVVRPFPKEIFCHKPKLQEPSNISYMTS